MNNCDKMKKMSERKFSGNKGNFKRLEGIFYNYEDGDNIVRLVGLFRKVKTHFVAPSKKNKQFGVCKPEAFEGQERLSYYINCPDWSLEEEKDTYEKKCPICKMYFAAKREMKDNPTMSPERKKYLEQITSKTRPTYAFKWNVIDRRDPYVDEVDGDNKRKVKGFKVATVGMEIWKGLEQIFKQLDRDIADEDEGIDLCIKRGSNGVRVSYTVQAQMEGLKVKETPLTEEERQMDMHDLKRLCGKEVDVEKILDNLNDQFKKYLDSLDNPDEQSSNPELTEEELSENVDDEPTLKDAISEMFEGDNDEEPSYNEESIECFGSAEDGHPECVKCASYDACREARDK